MMKMEAKHAPGPWFYVSQKDWPHRQDVYISANCWGVVATASIDPSLPVCEVQRANLSLLAAAPELLEALIALTDDVSERFDLDSSSTNPGIKSCVADARAAIAKATT